MDLKRTLTVGGESSGVVGVACFEDQVYVVCARSKLVYVLADPESIGGPSAFEVSVTMKVEQGKQLETSGERTEQVDRRMEESNAGKECYEEHRRGSFGEPHGRSEENEEVRMAEETSGVRKGGTTIEADEMRADGTRSYEERERDEEEEGTDEDTEPDTAAESEGTSNNRIYWENCQATYYEDLQSGHWETRNDMAQERVKGEEKERLPETKVDQGANKKELDKGDDISFTGTDGLEDIGKQGDDSWRKEVKENAKNEVRKNSKKVKRENNPEKANGMDASGHGEVHGNNNRKETVLQTTGGSRKRRGKRSKKKDNEADEQKDKKAAEQKAEVKYSMIDPQDMVCSDICRSIFISDRSCRCLWQIQLPSRPLLPLSAALQLPQREIFQIVWVTETGWPQKMSTTPSRELLVVCRRADQYNLAICRPWEGAVDQLIPLPTKIIYVWHAVQKSNGNFVISHLNRTILDGPPARLISELSVEDGNGNVIRTFDPTMEDSIDLTRWRPYHIALDHTSDRLFITDSSGRCRVLTLDSDLIQIRVLLDRDAHQLHQPERLCFIPNKRQMYVGQTDWTRSSCPSSVLIYNLS